jgi:N6-L-threonylcarbamoyladenine synthase
MRRGDSLDFSFSGLKTAFVYAVRDLGPEQTERRRADLAASLQRAVVDALVWKLEQALDTAPVCRVTLGGGVAANSELRERVAALCAARGLELKIPAPELCTDNAAMIASAARFLEPVPYPEYLEFDAFARTAA